ncbi:MAG: murein L,D-transpeptidase catalytic domain-containing protein [Chryseosolibacter sp.]
MSTLQYPSTTWPDTLETSEYFDGEHRADNLDQYTPFSEEEAVTDGIQDEDEDEPVYEVDDEIEHQLLTEEAETSEVDRLYQTLALAGQKMQEDTFRIAMRGYQKLKDSGTLKLTQYLTICDFSQPGNEKRMYILDIPARKLLLRCKVSHGKNSVKPGDPKKNATQFSNRIGSNQSSLGFYVTLSTYQGKHGLSLALEGVEKDFNNNARRRRVVVHGADYVRDGDTSPAGLSWGCPAIDMKFVDRVINTIKGGSCFFIFARNAAYLQKSTLASAHGIVGTVKDIASSVWRTGSTVLSSLATAAATTASVKVDPGTVERIRKFDAVIERLSRENKFNPNIVRGIIAAESGGNARSGEGRTGYKGLMQADTGTEQFDPATSIRRGIEKFNAFKGYLKAGLSRLKISIDLPEDEAYAQMVLACYNAGHVTVVKAIQYAHQAGNWRHWLQPEFYQRALLFSGGYDYYSNCAKNSSAAEIQKAKVQGKAYRYDRNRHWSTHKDPPPWKQALSLLSPILGCWIQTKMKNTPGYLDRFLAYFRSFSSTSPAFTSRESPDMPDHEHDGNNSSVNEGEEFEDPEQLYGPEYFDTSEVENEGQEDFLETEDPEQLNEGEDPLENFEADAEEEDLLARWEDGQSEAESEPVYQMEEEGAIATKPLAAPPLISDDIKVPSYTLYVRIPIGKANYVLDKTGIFIPANFAPSQPVTIICYLHGMTGTFPGPKVMIDKYWEVTKLPAYDFRLREEINQADRNVIFMAPSLGNSPNAYKNTLSNTDGGLDDYLQKAIQAINHHVCQARYNVESINFNKLILAAHSAGGSQMRRIATANNPLYGKRISECWGFDSLYGGMSVWHRWAKDHPDRKLFIYYKGSTQGNALLLKTMSKKLSNVFVINSSARNHYLVPKEHLRERVASL